MQKEESHFDRVGTLARELAGVEEGTLHGAPSWKLGGRLLCCPALHKSAEPDSLMVKTAPEDRERLLSTQPGTYYVTDHYLDQPVILVRLGKIDRKSLRELLTRAWLFLGESAKKKK